MTGTNRFNDQRGVVIHGKAYSREQILGVKARCYIVLRKSDLPPNSLEKYDNEKSQKANTIRLMNVMVNPSGKNSFEIISNGKVVHHFNLKSDTLAAEWIKCMKECLSFKSDFRRNGLFPGEELSGFTVSLLPSASHSFSGRFRLEVSKRSISLFQNANQCIVTWPFKCIRSYGIDRNKFTLATGHGTVTGRAEFVFEVFNPWKPYHVYHEVAAQISVCNSPYPSNGIYDEIRDVVDNEVYFEVPDNLGMTLQLPTRSFASILGLKECVRHLTLIKTGRCSRNNRLLLLYGAPHCGKRTLANALATELQARILSLRCSTLPTVLNADTLGLLSETFDRVLTLRRCVFFLDGIDIIPRGFQNPDIGHQVLLMIANFLHRVSSNRELVTICSTAFPWNVDESLQFLPGDKLFVPLPPMSVRLRVIRSRYQMSLAARAESVVETIAKRTSGFSMIELTALCSHLECVDGEFQLLQTEEVDDDQHLEEILERRMTEIRNCEGHQTNISSSASYYASQNTSQGVFFVTLGSNTTFPDVSSCFLLVTPSGQLQVRDLDPSQSIVSWTSNAIRGFGTDTRTFYLETGSTDATERGFFTFRTSEGAEIQQLIQTRCGNNREA